RAAELRSVREVGPVLVVDRVHLLDSVAGDRSLLRVRDARVIRVDVDSRQPVEGRVARARVVPDEELRPDLVGVVEVSEAPVEVQGERRVELGALSLLRTLDEAG